MVPALLALLGAHLPRGPSPHLSALDKPVSLIWDGLQFGSAGSQVPEHKENYPWVQTHLILRLLPQPGIALDFCSRIHFWLLPLGIFMGGEGDL